MRAAPIVFIGSLLMNISKKMAVSDNIEGAKPL